MGQFNRVNYLDMENIALCSHNHFICWDGLTASPAGSAVTEQSVVNIIITNISFNKQVIII